VLSIVEGWMEAASTIAGSSRSIVALKRTVFFSCYLPNSLTPEGAVDETET
jgi:hypothetical protein